MSAILLNGLSKSFGSFKAVSGLNLEVGENTVFGFLGPNGAGKTTTIRMMVGLIKPTKGNIKINDLPISFNNSKNHETFGYLPEQPSFYGWMTGEEYLKFVSNIFKLPAIVREKRVKELLKFTNLEEAKSRRIITYSNGMKQRLGIAQALINDPKVLILDEPVSALDPIGRREVLNVIEELGKTKTVFMSTHVLGDVDRICHEVAIIDKGKLVIQSSLAQLKEKYASPILTINFSSDPKDALASLKNQEWVKRTEKNGNQIKVWLISSEVLEKNLPIKALLKSNVGILNYGLTLPETEDLFLEILGGKNE